MAVLEKPFFPPLLARCSKHWRGIFPKMNHYIEKLVSFINHQTWKIFQREWSTAALTKNKKRWRKLVLHAAQWSRRITPWSTANYPAVYSKLSHKTIYGGVTCNKDDEEDEVMAEKTKKSSIAAQINTSWDKKWWKTDWSLPLSTGHEGLRHKVVHDSTSWKEKW